MDYFYLVQSLTEDRLVMVESQMGMIPIIVWAHFILGLTVLVKDSPDGNVIFGNIGNPQVIIKWSVAFPSSSFNHFRKHERWLSKPTIYLLDAGLEVLLKTEPDDNEGARIEGQECHRLKGYGATFLRRLFNKKTLLVDDDPIHVEAANFAVAFAILLARSMRRVPFKDEATGDNHDEVPTQCYLGTEQWRLFDSSRLLFWGIKLDKRIINTYEKKLTGTSIADMVLPTGIRNYLEKLEFTTYETSKDKFIEDIK